MREIVSPLSGIQSPFGQSRNVAPALPGNWGFDISVSPQLFWADGATVPQSEIYAVGGDFAVLAQPDPQPRYVVATQDGWQLSSRYQTGAKVNINDFVELMFAGDLAHDLIVPGRDRKYMINRASNTTISNLRAYTGGAITTVTFIGANGSTTTLDLSANIDSSIDLAAAGLTSPVRILWPESLTANTALTEFRCNNNSLTGSIPDLSANTALTSAWLFSNSLTGSNITAVSATLGSFQAQNNQLPQSAVDAILAAFVAAGRTSADGQVLLNLGGTGNAAPSAAGVTDKNTLISRGWTVTTN